MTGDGASGLRGIALFEAAKGALVVAAGFGLVSILHCGAEDVAAELLRHLHLNPAHHYPRIFLQTATRLQDANLRTLAAGAFAYSMLRFVEAYGLWFSRPWAQWLAIASGIFYIPFELMELQRRVTLLRMSVLAINVAIVLYVAAVRFREARRGAVQS